MLSELIDQYIEKREEENKRGPSLTKAGKPKFYPSMLGRCRRQIAYNMQGYPKPSLPPRVIRIMDNGNSMHERFETLFAEMGILLAAEMSMNENSDDEVIKEICEQYRISGRSDAIVRIDDEVYIIDLKSANEKRFERMKSRNEPDEEYYLQIQLYMHISGIHQGFLLVENKNTQELWEYPVTYDEEVAMKILSDIDMINRHNDSKTLPDRDYDRTSFQCRYCDFRSICWEPKSKGLYG